MTEIQVNLPDEILALIDIAIAKEGFEDVSQYVREIICADLQERDQDRLEELLLEGVNSGDPVEVDKDYWQRKKVELIRRHGLQQHA